MTLMLPFSPSHLSFTCLSPPERPLPDIFQRLPLPLQSSEVWKMECHLGHAAPSPFRLLTCPGGIAAFRVTSEGGWLNIKWSLDLTVCPSPALQHPPRIPASILVSCYPLKVLSLIWEKKNVGEGAAVPFHPSAPFSAVKTIKKEDQRGQIHVLIVDNWVD